MRYVKLYQYHRLDNGGSTRLLNGLLQRDYTAVYPTRLLSSYSLPLEPEISHYYFLCFGIFHGLFIKKSINFKT
jgi:hypothetical protein